MSFFAAVILPLLLLGGALMWLGVRGRRVDDHPICRRCGFDLFGRPEGSDRCAECGYDLGRPRAMRDGRRERRGGLLGGGVALLLVALALAGGKTYTAYLASDVQANKPSWWLVRELDSGDPAVAAAAAQELSNRVLTRTLVQRHIDDAVDRMLERQADEQRTWDRAFGDFIDGARQANQLDDARYHRYAAQAARFALIVRPRINRGDPLPFAIRELPARIGSQSTLKVHYTTTGSIDGLVVAGRVSSLTLLTNHDNDAVASAMSFAPKVADQLADGRHEAKVVVHLEFHSTGARAEPTPLLWTKKVLTAPFELLPAEPSAVEVVRDDALRPTIERAVRVTQADYEKWTPDEFQIGLRLDAVPIDVAFDVFVRTADGKEYPLTSIATVAGAAKSAVAGGRIAIPNLAGDGVELVLRPSVRAAKRTPDVFGVWDGEIVKRDLTVKRVTPPGAAAR
jgi:ribosomal protein L37E